MARVGRLKYGPAPRMPSLDQYAGPDNDDEVAGFARLLKREISRVCRVAGLTDCQAQVFRERVKGYGLTEIAAIIGCSKSTVSEHLDAIMERVNRIEGVGMFTCIVEQLGWDAIAYSLGRSTWPESPSKPQPKPKKRPRVRTKH